jgi:hypothetical protein
MTEGGVEVTHEFSDAAAPGGCGGQTTEYYGNR